MNATTEEDIAGEEDPEEDDSVEDRSDSDDDDAMETTPDRESVSPEIAAILDDIYGYGNWWTYYRQWEFQKWRGASADYVDATILFCPILHLNSLLKFLSVM